MQKLPPGLLVFTGMMIGAALFAAGALTQWQ